MSCHMPDPLPSSHFFNFVGGLVFFATKMYGPNVDAIKRVGVRGPDCDGGGCRGGSL